VFLGDVILGLGVAIKLLVAKEAIYFSIFALVL
jgi:hypothetical protein